MCNSKVRPWLDEQGKLHCDQVIEKISKSWSSEEWELFLKETVERQRHKKEILQFDYKTLMEKNNQIVSTGDYVLPKIISIEIHRSLKLLTKQQQSILKLTFWGGFSEREIASTLKILRSNVSRSKSISLNKIKHFLKNHEATWSYIIGERKNLTSKNDWSRSIGIFKQVFRPFSKYSSSFLMLKLASLFLILVDF